MHMKRRGAKAMRKRIGLFDNWTFAFHPGTDPVTETEAAALEYRPVTIPHDWMICRPVDKAMQQGPPQGYFDRWGTGFYGRALTAEKKPDTLYRLCFDGVYENCRVWVNGVPVGGQGYGYTPFTLDVTQALRDGENRLLVQVDNTRFPADRWYSGAGIYRMVWLETVPAEHLEPAEVTVETALTDRGPSLSVNAAHPGRKRISMEGPQGTWQEVTEGDTVTFCDPSLRLWSAEQPNLYTLTVELLDGEKVLDALTFRTGLRTVRADRSRGLLVNNVPTKLKGVCLHQDAGCFGAAVTPELWRERFKELKKTGCNALRLAHHLYMPEVLDLCDEMGFYVYEEAFDKWTSGAYARYYEQDWRRDLTAMVLRDRNRPSILFWGVGNEVEGQAHTAMVRLLENHVAAVKELDATRPVSLAMNPFFGYEERPALADEVNVQHIAGAARLGEILDMDDKLEYIRRIAERVDVLGCNYMEQWYGAIHAAIPDKLVLGTETYQFFRGKGGLFQAYNDQCPWLDVPGRDWCAGGFVWSGIDYLGESAVWPAKGWSGALFTTDMEPRPMAFAYQSYWTDEPVVHFAVLDMSVGDEGVQAHWDAPRWKRHWSFPQFQAAVIPYMVATNCEQVEIHLRGKCFRPAPTREFPNGIVQGFLPWWPGELTVVGLRDGKEVCRDAVVTPGPAAQLRFDGEETAVTLRRDGGGRAMPFRLLCKVRAYDMDGNPVFHEYARVRFTVEGPAEIVGADNGDMQRADPFTGSEVHLYGGHASAALRITGAGRVRVAAHAPGLRPAGAVIIAE